MNGDSQAETVEHRHHCQHLVSRAEHGVGGQHLGAQSIEVQVGQQDTLGDAGSAAGIEDDRHILSLFLRLIFPMISAAPAHKLVPAQDWGILGDLLHLPPLGEHVAGLDGLRQGILDRGQNDVVQIDVMADGLKLMVKLVQSDGEQGA